MSRINLSRIKQIAFYGIMVVLTLAVIEGMAQAAYYIAYGEFNGGGPSRFEPTADAADTADAAAGLRVPAVGVLHPYYGVTHRGIEAELNRVPPPRRENGAVLIGLVGGSVAGLVAPALQSALEVWFRDNDIPLRPVILNLSIGASKQPQQVMVIANNLLLGGEYDIIVNVDGRNDLIYPHENYFGEGVSPFYPRWWDDTLSRRLDDTQKLLVSRIYALRQRQQLWGDLATATPWRWSALYGIVNRYFRERADAQILTLNHELAATLSSRSGLQRYGPPLALTPAPDEYDLLRMTLRVWYRGSVVLHELSRAAGAEYYHFLQPNQYVPGSKPLTEQELARAYVPEGVFVTVYRAAYPVWQRLGDELRRQGIEYHDLTQIFAGNRETLYIDQCCHLNERGNELLAASMVQRMEPALRRRADRARAAAQVGDGGSGTASGTALDAAAQETSPVHAVNKLHFDVELTEAGALRYARDSCRPAHTASPFVVQVTPADAADRLPSGAASGYNRHEFNFDRDGGIRDAAGRCVVEYELPDYEIAQVLTGQYHPETGELQWRAQITLDWGFEVGRTAAGALRYARDNCVPAHLSARFFLHITPVDAADLAPGRAVHGYDNDDFSGYSPDDGAIDAAGRCVVERELPDYDIASIRTGQYIPAVGRRLWETQIDLEQP